MSQYVVKPGARGLQRVPDADPIINVHAEREYILKYPLGCIPWNEPEDYNSTPIEVKISGIKFPSLNEKTDNLLWMNLCFALKRLIPEFRSELYFSGEGVLYGIPSPLSYPSKGKWDYTPSLNLKTVLEANTLTRRIIDGYNSIFDLVDQFYDGISNPKNTSECEEKGKIFVSCLFERVSKIESAKGREPSATRLNLEGSLTYRPPETYLKKRSKVMQLLSERLGL